MQITVREVLSVLFIVASIATLSHGFSEDLCFNNGSPINCVPQDPPECGGTGACAFEQNTECCRNYAALRFRAGINNSSPRAHSMVHVDSTYYVLLSLGFDPDFAYFVAAYEEATDISQYKPVDKCGNQINDTDIWTAVMNGFQRQNYCTAGLLIHWPFPYIQNLNAPQINEKQLEAVYRWGFHITDKLCVGGWTEPSNGDYFVESNDCFCPGSTLEDCFEYNLNGRFSSFDLLELYFDVQNTSMTAFPWKAYTGNQIAYVDYYTSNENQYTPNYWDDYDGLSMCDNIVPESIVYAKDFDDYLRTQPQGRLPDGSVPVYAARLGVYVHSLQDAFSHYQCIGGSFYSDQPGGNDKMAYFQDIAQCAQGLHALRHYWEVGFDELPDQVEAALRATYQQLSLFKDRYKNSRPDFFVQGFDELSEDEVIDDIASVLTLVDPSDRLARIVSLEQSRGWQPMPGMGDSYNCPIGTPNYQTYQINIPSRSSGSPDDNSSSSSDASNTQCFTAALTILLVLVITMF